MEKIELTISNLEYILSDLPNLKVEQNFSKIEESEFGFTTKFETVFTSTTGKSFSLYFLKNFTFEKTGHHRVKAIAPRKIQTIHSDNLIVYYSTKHKTPLFSTSHSSIKLLTILRYHLSQKILDQLTCAPDESDQVYEWVQAKCKEIMGSIDHSFTYKAVKVQNLKLNTLPQFDPIRQVMRYPGKIKHPNRIEHFEPKVLEIEFQEDALLSKLTDIEVDDLPPDNPNIELVPVIEPGICSETAPISDDLKIQEMKKNLYSINPELDQDKPLKIEFDLGLIDTATPNPNPDTASKRPLGLRKGRLQKRPISKYKIVVPRKLKDILETVVDKIKDNPLSDRMTDAYNALCRKSPYPLSMPNNFTISNTFGETINFRGWKISFTVDGRVRLTLYQTIGGNWIGVEDFRSENNEIITKFSISKNKHDLAHFFRGCSVFGGSKINRNSGLKLQHTIP